MSLLTFMFFPRKLENAGILASNSIFTSCDLKTLHSLSYKEAKALKTLTYDEIKSIAKIPLITDTYSKVLSKKRFSKLYIFDDVDVNNKFSFINDNKELYTYSLESDFKKPYSEKRLKEDLLILKTKFAVNNVNITVSIQDRALRNLLFDLVNENINSGEHVEIYSQWIDMDTPEIWGPPDNTYDIYLEDVLNNRKFYLTTNSNDRYIIHKT